MLSYTYIKTYYYFITSELDVTLVSRDPIEAKDPMRPGLRETSGLDWTDSLFDPARPNTRLNFFIVLLYIIDMFHC